MIYFHNITRYFMLSFFPGFNAWMTRVLYTKSTVKFGAKLRADSIPRVIVDRNAKLLVGSNVELRRNVEIRVHGNATVVIEDNVRLDRGVRILAANHAEVRIETGARIGLYSVLNGGDSIFIGKGSLISGFVYLQTSMHGFKNKNVQVQDQGYEHRPVRIERDAWLGAHVVVMPGVVISEGAVVGSNAVVNKSVEKFNVVAGVPAKVISERA